MIIDKKYKQAQRTENARLTMLIEQITINPKPAIYTENRKRVASLIDVILQILCVYKIFHYKDMPTCQSAGTNRGLNHLVLGKKCRHCSKTKWSKR